MYNYRYTLGPEILVPDVFFASAGFWTHYNEDGTFSFNTQLGLADKFEIGLKYLAGTQDGWIISKSRSRSNSSLIDIGAKYAITPTMALQADFPMSINRDWDWGGIVSLSQWNGHTKNVSSVYEGRIAFGGASGIDNHAKLSAAFVPDFQLGSAFRLSACAVGSASIENVKNDFMFDMLPRIEAGFKSFRVMGEVSIGILTYDAEKYNRYALFVASDI
jgi:hypothetical protein